jgi:transcriptional regulator with XRE-family HTH domain
MANGIEAKRNELGMTRAAFAEAMQVDYTTVWKWENGKEIPHHTRMKQLASVLKTSLPELFPDLFGPTAS